MNSKLWITGYLIIIFCLLSVVAYKVIDIDPFFHYHKPDTDNYSYRLNNERSQNDGIIKHFDYSGLITGTSLAENFRTSEAESLWGGTFIKVPFSGATYKEINNNLKTAASSNKDLKIVIRGLDMSFFFTDKDFMRDDLGNYPLYLYDNNPFNDVKYLFNRDIVFQHVYSMITNAEKGIYPNGITSFDSYANWMSVSKFGKEAVFPEGLSDYSPKASGDISENEIESVRVNITQNVTDLADEYPDITFYCFFTPYSAVYWLNRYNEGRLRKQIQAERVIIEEVLKHENIKLFSFNCRFDITTDLNHYKDRNHYGEWINSLMLRWMHDDKYLLTEANYEQYLNEEYDFYSNYDFSELMDTADYENDYYAAALINHEITGAVPYHVDFSDTDSFELSHAEVAEDLYEGGSGVICKGTLQRSSEQTVGDYLLNTDYVGMRILIEDITPYRYLVFYGRRDYAQGQPTVKIYDSDGNEAVSFNIRAGKLDQDWHQYLIKIGEIKGSAILVLNGGGTGIECHQDSQFVFSDITLY